MTPFKFVENWLNTILLQEIKKHVSVKSMLKETVLSNWMIENKKTFSKSDLCRVTYSIEESTQKAKKETRGAKNWLEIDQKWLQNLKLLSWAQLHFWCWSGVSLHTWSCININFVKIVKEYLVACVWVWMGGGRF